jgi:hypothetical protein
MCTKIILFVEGREKTAMSLSSMEPGEDMEEEGEKEVTGAEEKVEHENEKGPVRRAVIRARPPNTVCSHLDQARPAVFLQALSRTPKKKKKKHENTLQRNPTTKKLDNEHETKNTGFVCCTCGKNVDKEHFGAGHPLGYYYDDQRLWCLVCPSVLSPEDARYAKDERVIALVDMLENAGLTFDPSSAFDPSPATDTMTTTPASSSSSSFSSSSPPSSPTSSVSTPAVSLLPFYHTATLSRKDYLTMHLLLHAAEKGPKKKVKNMHGGHGHNHGPINLKKGMSIPLSVWLGMDAEVTLQSCCLCTIPTSLTITCPHHCDNAESLL